jgi:hypothetical protein
MRTTPLGCAPAYVIAIALINSTVAGAQERSRSKQPKADSASTAAPATPRTQPRLVRIPDPLARRATVSALNTAVARFEDAACRKILLDFTDRDGLPLEDRLTSLRLDFDHYVSTLVFYDGTRSRTCDKGAMAFTAPGSRVVYVCVNEVMQVHLGRPEYVIAILIHEILHTLGLGENPPSSSDITRRVLALCGQSSAHRAGVR